MIAKLDRLARSLRDAKDIVDGLTAKNVKLSIDGSVHDPNDPVGRLLFNVLAMLAEFESDLIRARTRGGMQITNAKGHRREQVECGRGHGLAPPVDEPADPRQPAPRRARDVRRTARFEPVPSGTAMIGSSVDAASARPEEHPCES